jgi:putative tricarboxylic transport membrane protein
MILEGIMLVLNPVCLGLILMGVIIGIIFGAMPGLSATMASSCSCAFFRYGTYKRHFSAYGALPGAISGGLITAILLKIPGLPPP